MAYYIPQLTNSLPSDRAIVVFSIRTPNETATVHLVGSWDNFSAPLLMGKDFKSNAGVWKICLGSSKYGAGASIDGLKMGGRYTYYFVINGHIQMPDPTVAERVVDPRSGTICSIFNAPFQVAAGQKVIAGSPELATTESFARELSACKQRQSQKAYPFNLNQNDEYAILGKPGSASNRANAPQRPTVVIPNRSQQTQTSPVSAVPSLTPSSGLNSAVSPTSVGTPYSGRLNLRSKRSFGFGFSRSNSVRELGERTYTPSEVGKKRGFHLKTPSIPSISNLINYNSSKPRSGFPVISNPIPQDFDRSYHTGGLSRSSSTASRRQAQCTGLGINMASCQSSRSSLIEDDEQEILEAQDQAYNAVRSRKMASSISRPLSVASTTISDSPSLTQSEFSVESSPSPVDDTSSISSSPMQSFDSDVEIETDDEEENVAAAIMASKLQIGGKYAYSGLDTVRVDDLADMENWYRSAAGKSRSSRHSRSTRFSDVSCATRFEESQDDLYPTQTSSVNRSWPLESKSRRLSPSLPVHAPMPVRPEAEAIVAIESMEVQAEARLRSLIRSSWGRFDYVEIGSESISEEYQNYLAELNYLRREVEDLRREKEYFYRHLPITEKTLYY
ncbi:hypothetical protein TWF102_011805 [Orbilia oligospora]|uniref:AMP-activated protein kinase glycogen-binding domain-containing protein n=1 Tax=Orbilia oligospora TaxID=2813651 RepID=A0A7C8MXU0_ORBOL|nr:hypothetical protein TWF706_002108 [Orbilia oligospora]KAF3084857.1 hypothetical protein TWF102_011805 [Orbilia oligospora]KAF3091627.1 hypothetical protein TWF103_011623 [Orbilia oligospora]KAF3129111.1 hypothetical protein TWF594_011123 [Orbilia oligospora]